MVSGKPHISISFEGPNKRVWIEEGTLIFTFSTKASPFDPPQTEDFFSHVLTVKFHSSK